MSDSGKHPPQASFGEDELGVLMDQLEAGCTQLAEAMNEIRKAQAVMSRKPNFEEKAMSEVLRDSGVDVDALTAQVVKAEAATRSIEALSRTLADQLPPATPVRPGAVRRRLV